MERQQGSRDRLYLFENMAPLRPGADGKGGARTAAFEASQASAALGQQRALTTDLMERACDRENLNRAYKRVKSQEGSTGMTFQRLKSSLAEHEEMLAVYFCYAECRGHLKRLYSP